jgi:hypothetical protein
MTDEALRLDEEQLIADAHALERLAEMPEWAVLDRLMAEHIVRIQLALRQRGLGLVETEALRSELEAVEWLRYRPIALRRAVVERDRMRNASFTSTQGPQMTPMRSDGGTRSRID